MISQPSGKVIFDADTKASHAKGFAFGKNSEYAVSVAGTAEERLRAWRLVYRTYREKHYAERNPDGLWYGLHDALPDTRTFLVTHHNRDVATLTLVFDSPLALPADTLYADELTTLRRQNRRLCEITSLVNVEMRHSECMEVLNQAFHAAYLMAHRVEGATDFVITVNPHHASYYKRKLFFEQRGEQRSYKKVAGAPAVLLRLPLTGLAKRYAEKQRAKPDSKSFYRFFVEPDIQSEKAKRLAQARRSLSRRELNMWFCIHRPLLPHAHSHTRNHVLSMYRQASAA